MVSLGSTLEMLLSMPTIVFVFAGTVSVVAIIAGTVSKTLINRARERTRREIAAYVAEGSIDADKAVEMLKAGRSSSDCNIAL